MSKLSERGVVHLLLPLILILGLIASVYLVTSSNPLKLFSRAAAPISAPISFVCIPCAADVNQDRVVNIYDLSKIGGCVGVSPGSNSRCPAALDVNRDGFINQADLDCVRDVFDQRCVPTPSPAPTATPSASFGKAVTFPSGDNFISSSAELPFARNLSGLNPRGPMTLETWVRINGDIPASAPGYLINKAADYDYPTVGRTTAPIYYLQLVQNRITIHINDTSRQVSGFVSVIPLPTSFTIGTWHHIAGMYDGQNIKLFVDGVEKGAGNLTPANPLIDDSLPFYIERTVGNTGLAIPVSMDEVRISKGVRYTSNFQPPTTPFIPDNNTLLLWHFDSSELTPEGFVVTRDASINQNDGLVIGNVQFIDSNIPTGISIPLSTICIPCGADADKNGSVGIIDMMRVAQCMRIGYAGSAPGNFACRNADANGDGQINASDLNCVRQQYGKPCKP